MAMDLIFLEKNKSRDNAIIPRFIFYTKYFYIINLLILKIHFKEYLFFYN